MIRPFRKQSGSILLTLMLVIIVAASFTLVSKLNASSRAYIRQQSTMDILRQAKAALIAYAVTYPERSGNPTAGPGILPCPDTTNNGQALANCSFGGGTTTGRFPWRTLNSGILLDQTGEVPWYAVTDNYRTPPPGPINSDTPGQLSVDGIGDIVAVIIAPGAPVVQPAQNRTGANLNNAVHYLEGANADGDTVFTRNSGGNDALIYITRQELMQAVEKRVSGDIAQAIMTYQSNQNAFPWLSPFAAPNASSFRGQVPTYQGHVPFHWAADPNSVSNGGAIAGRNPFTTNIQESWNINNATITDLDPDNLINNQVLRNSAYNDPIFGVISPVNVANAQCTWTDRISVNCTGNFSTTVPCPNLCGGGNGTCSRTYQFNVQYSGTPTINNPTNVSVRTRDVAINNSALPVPAPVTWLIQVNDSYTRKEYFAWWWPCPPWNFVTRNGTKNLTIDADTTGTVTTQGIQYDIDLDGVDLNADGDYTGNEIIAGVDLNGDGDQLDVEVAPELPLWFGPNNWEDFVYIAYPAAEALPGGVALCSTGGGTCLTLNNVISQFNPRALVISAGVNLTVNNPRIAITDFFEGANSIIDETFVKAQITNANNDQVRVIAVGGP